MTDDDFEQLILFTLIDVDLTGATCVAIDYDGEIILGMGCDLYVKQSESGGRSGKEIYLWKGEDSKWTDVFLPFDEKTMPENYKTVLIKL